MIYLFHDRIRCGFDEAALEATIRVLCDKKLSTIKGEMEGLLRLLSNQKWIRGLAVD